MKNILVWGVILVAVAGTAWFSSTQQPNAPRQHEPGPGPATLPPLPALTANLKLAWQETNLRWEDYRVKSGPFVIECHGKTQADALCTASIHGQKESGEIMTFEYSHLLQGIDSSLTSAIAEWDGGEIIAKLTVQQNNQTWHLQIPVKPGPQGQRILDLFDRGWPKMALHQLEGANFPRAQQKIH